MNEMPPQSRFLLPAVASARSCSFGFLSGPGQAIRAPVVPTVPGGVARGCTLFSVFLSFASIATLAPHSSMFDKFAMVQETCHPKGVVICVIQKAGRVCASYPDIARLMRCQDPSLGAGSFTMVVHSTVMWPVC